MSLLTLTTDSDARKRIPLIGGLWGYFPAALVGVAKHSFKSNEKHNPGQPLHWSFDKSNDHAECCGRHLVDLHELRAAIDREPDLGERIKLIGQLLDEANAHAWRALALSQTLHMEFDGAPLPFNAKRSLPEPEAAIVVDSVQRPEQGGPAPWTSNCDTTAGPCRCGAWH